MVGAILTQNTSWTNVEKAIAALMAIDAMDPAVLVAMDADDLATRLRPVGYFNIKAKRLRSFCRWYLEQGRIEQLSRRPTDELRRDLLSVHGVGPETADDILLYAFERPVFVIDAYTRRLFGRLGLLDPEAAYEQLRRRFEQALGADAPLYNEYHAQIVIHAKHICRSRPSCDRCCLADDCPRQGVEVPVPAPG